MHVNNKLTYVSGNLRKFVGNVFLFTILLLKYVNLKTSLAVNSEISQHCLQLQHYNRIVSLPSIDIPIEINNPTVYKSRTSEKYYTRLCIVNKNMVNVINICVIVAEKLE